MSPKSFFLCFTGWFVEITIDSLVIYFDHPVQYYVRNKKIKGKSSQFEYYILKKKHLIYLFILFTVLVETVPERRAGYPSTLQLSCL